MFVNWNIVEITKTRITAECNPEEYKTFACEKQCPVCLDTKTNQGKLDCDHFVCLRCLLSLKKNECPLCRKPLSAPWLQGDLWDFMEEQFDKYREEQRQETELQDQLVASFLQQQETPSLFDPVQFIRTALFQPDTGEYSNIIVFNGTSLFMSEDEDEIDENNNTDSTNQEQNEFEDVHSEMPDLDEQ